MTDTGYTSWTTNRSLAEEAAQACGDTEGLSGQIVIFRVRVGTLDLARVFEGRADEEEYLIEGIAEAVAFSEDASDEEVEATFIASSGRSASSGIRSPLGPPRRDG